MSDAGEDRGSDVDPAVAAYKALLRDFLNRRPSGTRQKIAAVIGTHKSFVSQVANPTYRVPLPAQHVPTIMALCHFSPEERTQFLRAYTAAHPGQLAPAEPARDTPDHVLHIELPRFRRPELSAQVEETIREVAARIVALAREADTKE